MKVCSKCQVEKPIEDFAIEKKRGNPYRRTDCKACRSISHKLRYNTDFGREYQRNQYEKSKEYMLWRDAKRRAIRKNIDFTISVNDIIIPSICPVLGIPIFRRCNGISDNSASLDRIDTTKGYIRENICVISNKANAIKNNGNIKEHEMIIQYLISIANNSLPQIRECYSDNEISKRDIANRLHTRAKRRNIYFDLTFNDIVIPKICPVLNIPIRPSVRVADDYSPSVDRLIPHLGYIKSNIFVISNKANILKSDSTTLEDHLKILDYLKSHLS